MTGSQKMYMHARRCTLRISIQFIKFTETLGTSSSSADDATSRSRLCGGRRRGRQGSRYSGPAPFQVLSFLPMPTPLACFARHSPCKRTSGPSRACPTRRPALIAGSQPIPIHYSHVASGRGEPDDLCMCSKLGENFTMRYNPGKRAE